MTHRHVFMPTFDARYERCAFCAEQQRAPTPREVGEVAGTAALNTAQRLVGFNAIAVERFFIDYLSKHGQASGEDLTDAAKNAGYVPHDDRAFGPIFASLARSRIIRVLDFAERRKGHGTSGARVWALS